MLSVGPRRPSSSWSYFCKRPETLRRVQMLGALMWVAYGLLVHALPVVVANLLVLSAAAWTARRSPAAVPSRELKASAK